MKKNNSKLKVIPLGGLGEIGKNITAIECDDEIVIIDCGFTFPDSDMYGVDIVIPDVTYLVENKEKIKGFFITHGHEDHIGALPHVLEQINVPVYGAKLTMALVESKLVEHKMLDICELNVITPGDIIDAGLIKVEFIRTNHSIPDACSIALHTPVGVIFHTGDFKIDFTPIDGKLIDIARISEIGKRGVLLLMADSTNAVTPGYTMSESRVGETLDNLFNKCKTGRIIVSTFASNVHRLQQIINSSEKYGRKVVFSGRSMEKISEISINLGYLNIPEGTLIELKDMKLYNNEQITIVTTGSQGEPMAALTRISAGTHRSISIEKDDTVIISATPIPGNKKPVSKVINELNRKGANVIYKSIEEIHVSGHACQEELKLIHSLLKPKFFIPIHGETKHLIQHAKIAEELGMNKANIFIIENGDVLNLTRQSARVIDKVHTGKILIDGSMITDVGSVVLRDRKYLSQDGIVTIVVVIDRDSQSIISGPDVVTRGFVYVREADELVKEIRNISSDSIEKCMSNNIYQWSQVKRNIRNDVSYFIFGKIKRRPMIVPVIIEV